MISKFLITQELLADLSVASKQFETAVEDCENIQGSGAGWQRALFTFEKRRFSVLCFVDIILATPKTLFGFV